MPTTKGFRVAEKSVQGQPQARAFPVYPVASEAPAAKVQRGTRGDPGASRDVSDTPST